MEKINFIKMHGLGNDFVIIDKRLNDINISDDLIKKLSDRKSGAGCDQLITINQSNNKNIDAKIEIFNPNGAITGIESLLIIFFKISELTFIISPT